MAGIGVRTHDCYGVIVRSKRKGVYEFLCDECGAPYAILSKRGLSVESRHRHSKRKGNIDKNLASLNAVKWLIRDIEGS